MSTLKAINPEFDTWSANPGQNGDVEVVRESFDVLLQTIKGVIPAHNARYLALVKTNLEMACFCAIKGIIKPLDEAPAQTGVPNAN